MQFENIHKLEARSTKSHIKNSRFFTPGYFDLAEGLVLGLIIFGVLIVILPSQDILPHSDTVFAAATFLFGIAAGYYIQNRHDRYSQMRGMVAQEAASLINMYESAKLIGSELELNVVHGIEKYIIRTYHHKLDDYVIASEEEFSALLENMRPIEKRLQKQESVATGMFENYLTLNDTREQIYVLGQDKLAWYDWFALLLLSILILISLFSIGFQSITIRFIALLLATTLLVIVLTIRDLDKLHRNDKLMMYGTYDRVLDRMGRPRIYLEKDIKSGEVDPVKYKDFRLIV